MASNLSVRPVHEEVQDGRRRAKAGKELCPAVWIVDGALAVVQRPLRDHPVFHGRHPMPPDARPEVERWAKEMWEKGFRGMLCLSHEKELAYYAPLNLHDDGLLGFLRAKGFVVTHLPALDPLHAKTDEERAERRAAVEGLKDQATTEFERLPKPVAMFCSAGIDRSTPIALSIAAGMG